MKKLIIAVLIALCGTAAYASPGIDNISHDDFEKLKKAVALVDEGLSNITTRE